MRAFFIALGSLMIGFIVALFNERPLLAIACIVAAHVVIGWAWYEGYLCAPGPQGYAHCGPNFEKW